MDTLYTFFNAAAREYKENKQKESSCYLYCITLDNTHYKLGITNNIESRVKTFQTAHHDPIKIVFWHENACAEFLERTLHQYYKKTHKHKAGEWFTLTLENIYELLFFLWDIHKKTLKEDATNNDSTPEPIIDLCIQAHKNKKLSGYYARAFFMNSELLVTPFFLSYCFKYKNLFEDFCWMLYHALANR